MIRKIIACLILPIIIVSCNSKPEQYRQYIDLGGEWQFALDTTGIGEEQEWFLSNLNDIIILPGTTDANQKGFLNRDTTTMHLNRVYTYEGKAWYRKTVNIPPEFENKHIRLFLERTKTTRIWIDDNFVGGSSILQTPQVYDVSGVMTPGEHSITICVDNDLDLTPYGNVHIYSDETQTNWNGIIGKLYLEASSKTYISNLQVFPDIDQKKIGIKLKIENPSDLETFNVELFIEKTENGDTTHLKPLEVQAEYKPEMILEYQLGDESSLWDEYNQPLYSLTAVISNGDSRDSKTVPFGMKKFVPEGTQFQINGRTTFLRGKHDAAVFPLTGHTPMDVEDWTRVYRIAKSYGINHYRFHSYCPPEAAFTAADLEGIYLQAELPFWGGLDSDTIADMLLQEGFAMLKAYANHPSFVMFSHGNEIWSGQDRVEKNIIALKEYDDRPLYTMGSNNSIGYVPPRDCSDFFVAVRTPYEHDTVLTHTRLTHAFVDSRDGGILNTQYPSTEVNFSYAVSQIDIPLVTHEIGQYQIYPDYREIDKYTGVVRAWNLEVFRNRLIKADMLQMDSVFHQASGIWSALCYKAEMEAAIRTRGLAGFQLLDLQDFPGQGTALVGVLDAFMDSKHVITPEKWKQSCNDVVVLLEFPKYCWTNEEDFHALAVVANYSNTSFTEELSWEIRNEEGDIVQQGSFPGSTIKMGTLLTAGEIIANLNAFDEAEKLTINVSLPGTEYHNSYPLWIYPASDRVSIPDDILVSGNLNNDVIQKLKQGGKVLLFPEKEDVAEHSYPGLFPPEFWNYGMFKGISEWANKPVSPGTLGLLTDPEHPIFKEFPTDFHTNWQWFSIIKASNSLILDETADDYQPIVQVIDNLERNHKLGLIFEFKVGEGKLLICMSQLDQIQDKPEAVQLYHSIIDYMGSGDFDPDHEITIGELQRIIR